MASGRFGYPTPCTSEDPCPHRCPVCGWSPCTSSCSLGLSADEVLHWGLLFDADDEARRQDGKKPEGSP